ncbi:protoheme IX farnesyltransferase, partial [Francisella tularensis subsp. holarctica]|nr:protoheme IX farnesyltransferase [Francisella tularensis subsp. holarctica]
FYLALFVVSFALPAVIGSAYLFSFIVCILLALFWMYKSIQSYRTDKDRYFTKTVFKFSILVITSIYMTIG